MEMEEVMLHSKYPRVRNEFTFNSSSQYNLYTRI